MPLSRGADGEVVWSSRPDAGAKFCGHHPRSDGGRKAGHRGEREGNRKTIAQGKPDDPVEVRSPDAAQRHKRVYARLRHAMAMRC